MVFVSLSQERYILVLFKRGIGKELPEKFFKVGEFFMFFFFQFICVFFSFNLEMMLYEYFIQLKVFKEFTCSQSLEIRKTFSKAPLLKLQIELLLCETFLYICFFF